MTTQLLVTKLTVPPPHYNLVTRPRLIQRLDEGLCLGHKLTLISAPAGFGKTTLLSGWISNFGLRTADSGSKAIDASSVPERGSVVRDRVAWVSLDEGDNDPARFLAYLVGSLQTVQAGIGQAESNALQSPKPPSMEGLLAALINQIGAIPSDVLLILDDYHLITSESIHRALTFLIDHLPSNLHLVIATRADPPLPIPRLRGRGHLTEVRQADLRFTSDEATALLTQVMELELSANDVAALASRTEGWVAGLQMAAVSMRGREDISGFVRAFTGSDRFILDYLAEEVLQRQVEGIQTFLLRTAILDRLTGPLCNAVLGVSKPADQQKGQDILEYLERNNLFVVPLDNERRWYRYHRLFVDLLRARLSQAHPDQIPYLHRRASEWHEQNGLMAAAIDHALAAEDFARSADLIEQTAEATLMRGEVATFLRWAEALPPDLIRERPSLSVSHVWMLLLSGRPLGAVESRLQDVDRDNESIAGRIVALRALMAALQGQLSHAVRLSRQALAQLSEEDRFARDLSAWVLSAVQSGSDDDTVGTQAMEEVLRSSQKSGNVMVAVMVMSHKAELLMRQGQLRRAEETYRQALELATDPQGQRMPIAGQALVGLGELARELNDLDAATRYLVEGIHLAEQWTEVGPLEAYIALARVKQAQAEPDGAREALRKAQELAAKFDITEIDDVTVAMFQARLWIAHGNLEAARHWAEGRELHKYINSALQEERGASFDHRLRKYELLVLARLLIAERRFAEAATLLESLMPVAKRRRRPGLVIEIHVLQALAFQAQGNLDQATVSLERAISLAEPEGYVRVLVDEGEPMARLLREAMARGVALDYSGKLLSAFANKTKDDGRKTEPSHPSTVPSTSPLAALRTSLPRQSSLRHSSGQAEQAPGPSSALVEPLSERELEVLQLLNSHLSSTEIAQKLFISANTARFHIKNIYTKLSAHRRADAVQRARELHLL